MFNRRTVVQDFLPRSFLYKIHLAGLRCFGTQSRNNRSDCRERNRLKFPSIHETPYLSSQLWSHEFHLIRVWFESLLLIPLIENRQLLPQLIIYLFKDILGFVELLLSLTNGIRKMVTEIKPETTAVSRRSFSTFVILASSFFFALCRASRW